MKTVYAITLDADEVGYLAGSLRSLSQKYAFVASLSDAPEDLAKSNLEPRWENVSSLKERLSPLTSSHWPESFEQAIQLMTAAPASLTHWKLKNFLWQFSTGGFIYWANENTLKQQDITVHLTVARMFGHLTVAVIGSEMRSVLDVTQMTLTDVCAVEADKRTLSLLLENLTKETSMAPVSEGPTE